MYLTIIILPLLSSIISGFYGRKVGVTGAHIISCVSLFLSLVLTLIAMKYALETDTVVTMKLMNWWSSDIYNINAYFNWNNVIIYYILNIG